MPDNHFWRNASGRLVFEMSQVPADCYRSICDSIATKFKLVPDNSLVDGFDVVFQDFRRGEQVVGLEWDNWSGFIVVAQTAASESLVQDLAAWLLQSQWAAESNTELGSSDV